MLEIDALLTDGRSALTELQGRSPSGGFVTSESRVCNWVFPGDLIRHGDWSAVARTRHNGIHGLCAFTLIGQDGTLTLPPVLPSLQSVQVRTDTRIDPGTLHKLIPAGQSGSRPAASDAGQAEVTAAAAQWRWPSRAATMVGAEGPGTLASLQAAAPSGGPADIEGLGCTWITPGTLVRHGDAWVVTACTDHDGVNGLCRFTFIGPDGTSSDAAFVTGEALQVRADTRIEPFTLYKLIPAQTPATATSRAGPPGPVSAAPPARTARLTSGPSRRPGPSAAARRGRRT